jgi:hypothetical protein
LNGAVAIVLDDAIDVPPVPAAVDSLKESCPEIVVLAPIKASQ